MKEINEIEKSLPGLDCGSCGAPSCRAFAEDIVCGNADQHDCIIRFREDLAALDSLGMNISGILPAPFRNRNGQTKANEEEQHDNA